MLFRSSLMEQISCSTLQQEKGIEQITLALSELEKVTQSNVAVVEELAGSSDVLKHQVVELQTRTRNFRLGNEVPAQAVAPTSSKPAAVAVSTGEQNYWHSF